MKSILRGARPVGPPAARRRCSGHAVVEVALLSPFLFFLFVGALDWGFYAYALVSTENAARVSALASAASLSESGVPSQQFACQYALDEMKRLPNASHLPADCSSLPLIVQAAAIDDDEGRRAARVTVTYQTVPLIPIPGLLPGRLTISRTAEVRAFGG